MRKISLVAALCALSLGFAAFAGADDCVKTLDSPMSATAGPAERALADPRAPAILLAGLEPATRSEASVPTAGGCFTACYDLQTSEEFFGCAPGQNYAVEATGSYFGCCIVGGGSCISTGCDGPPASQCVGFATSCGGTCW